MVPGARSQVVAGRLGPLLAEVTSEWPSGLRAGDTQPVCLGQSPQHQEAGRRRGRAAASRLWSLGAVPPGPGLAD